MNAMAPVAPGPAATGSAVAVPSEQPGEISVVEQVVVLGDLARLTSEQRVEYYRRVCDSVGLNPLTRPFDYLILNNKLVLYANKNCTEQLRSNRGISIEKVERESIEDLFVVTAYGKDRTGRVDSSIGAVPFENLRGETKANAMMKAETKAKRRLTLSMAGLGMLDESEIDSVNGAQRVDVDPETGEILRTAPPIRLVGSGAGAAPASTGRHPDAPASAALPSAPAGIGAETSLGHVVLDGTIEVNDKQRTDAQMRQTPNGPKLGFRFVVAGGGNVGQVVASGAIAERIAEQIGGEGPRLNGLFATIAGELFAVPWKKKNAEGVLEAMPPTKRLDLVQLWTADWTATTAPAPTDATAGPAPAADPKQTTIAGAVHKATTAGTSLDEFTERVIVQGRFGKGYLATIAAERFSVMGGNPDEVLAKLNPAQLQRLADEVEQVAGSSSSDEEEI